MALVNEYTREQWERSGGWRSVESWVDAIVLLFHDDPLRDDEIAEESPVYRYWRLYQRNDDGNGWYCEDEGLEPIPKEELYVQYVLNGKSSFAPIKDI